MLRNKFRSLLSVFFILMGTAGAVNNTGRLLSRPIAAMVLQGMPVFSVSPSGPVDLGPSAIGVNTPHGFPVSIFISNLGSADLMVAPSFTSSEYGFTAESFFATAVTVLPGRTKRGDIIFMPQTAGPRIAQFISTDNATGNPHMVPLTGTGVNVAANDFALVLDPAVTLVGVSPGKTASFNVQGCPRDRMALCSAMAVQVEPPAVWPPAPFLLMTLTDSRRHARASPSLLPCRPGAFHSCDTKSFSGGACRRCVELCSLSGVDGVLPGFFLFRSWWRHRVL